MENPRGTDVRRGCTSASAASMDLACPGRHLAQRDVPEPPQDEAAESGNRIHAALANSSDTAALNALTIKEREIWEDCRAIEKRLAQDWFGLPDCPPIRVYREKRLWVKFMGPNQTIYEHSGGPDVIYSSGAKALILDYKTGSGDVEDASSNLQLRDLACLFRGDQMRQGQPVVECATAIIQPLATHEPVLCQYDEPAMDRAAQEMMERIVASNDPKSPRIPGEMQCKWCRAKATCMEHQKWASATLPAFRELISCPVEQWQPEQRAIFCDRYQVAKEWLESTWDAMRKGAENDPVFVPGYALSNGSVKHPVTDIKTLLDRIVAHGGTASGLLQECAKVSKEDLEAYFKRLVKGKIKGTLSQNKAFEGLLAGITTPRPSKPSLKKI